MSQPRRLYCEPMHIVDYTRLQVSSSPFTVAGPARSSVSLPQSGLTGATIRGDEDEDETRYGLSLASLLQLASPMTGPRSSELGGMWIGRAGGCDPRDPRRS